MTGTGPLIRPMTSADRSALADFPNRVSAGSAIFRFHGSVTVLTDKTLNLLLDLADGQREAITAVDDRGIAGWPGSRATTWIPPAPRLRSWWPTNGNIAAWRASSSALSRRGLEARE
jgi:hypothetical protein